MLIDEDTCYRAMVARDPRFDGRFFVGVLTTGVYCRPVCPARTPLRRNVRFFATAAAASSAGLRSCKRCRPDSLPGSRHWDQRSDLVARALRLIGSGAADTGLVTVAEELGVSERHLRREVLTELGTTPGRLARTRRAQTARLLVEQTTLPMTDIAFASGFRSLRQFNDVMRAEFALTPTQLRRHGTIDHSRTSDEPGSVALRLRHREPYDSEGMLGWLARHAVPGVDRVDIGAGTVDTTAMDGTLVRVRFGAGSVGVVLTGPGGADLSWLPGRVAAIRRWLDLDANPLTICDVLNHDPVLAPFVSRRPGVRVVGTPDPFRGVITAILGQQVSVAAAATHASRLVAGCFGGASDRFPAPEELASHDPDSLASSLGMPASRGRTLVGAARAVADGAVNLAPHCDRDDTCARLLAIPGIGPWTAADVRMRVLGDPDVWPTGDLVLRRAVGARGLAAGLEEDGVRPWRSYAAHQVWVAVATGKQIGTERNGVKP